MARAAKSKDVDALEQANEADTMVIRDELAAQEGLIKSKPIKATKVAINKTRGKSIWTATITQGRSTSQMTFTDYNRARSFVRRNVTQVGRYN